MRESEVSRSIRLAFGAREDTRLFRNNTGRFIQSNAEPARVAAALRAAGITFRYVQTGLCPGSSDLIGWHSVRLTSDMIGSQLAVFTAIECKQPGARTDPQRLTQQMNFIHAVTRFGGYAGMASSVDDVDLILSL